jgi:hypothetical protein
MSEFDFETYCAAALDDGLSDQSDAICEIKGLVDGAITGVDTFFLLFGVSRSCCWLFSESRCIDFFKVSLQVSPYPIPLIVGSLWITMNCAFREKVIRHNTG